MSESRSIEDPGVGEENMHGDVCRCHGEPTVWVVDGRLAAGGYRRCVVKKRAHSRRYQERYRADGRAAASAERFWERHGLVKRREYWAVGRRNRRVRENEADRELLASLEAKLSLWQ
jgi:hypothetical protein